VPDRIRRVPVAAEMHSFKAEVCSDERLMCGREAQHGAVVSDTRDQRTVSASGLGLSADLFDERFFGEGQSGNNIKDGGESTKQADDSAGGVA